MACEWRPGAASQAHAARGLRTASKTRRVAAAAHPPPCRRDALRSMHARTHARHPGCGQPRLWHTHAAYASCDRQRQHRRLCAAVLTPPLEALKTDPAKAFESDGAVPQHEREAHVQPIYRDKRRRLRDAVGRRCYRCWMPRCCRCCGRCRCGRWRGRFVLQREDALCQQQRAHITRPTHGGRQRTSATAE
jgi:hypothetical protein